MRPRAVSVPARATTVVLTLLFAVAPPAGSAGGESFVTLFDTQVRAEALATVTVTCARYAWDVTGREAAHRIVRDGCFRAAIPLPATAAITDVRGLRARVFARGGKNNAVAARLTRVNTVFALDERFVPGPPILRWQGAALLRPGGHAFELSLP